MDKYISPVNFPVTINWYIPEHFNGIEVVESHEEQFDIPFSPFEEVYYAYKKTRSWILIHSRISFIGISNFPSVQLENGMWVPGDYWNRIFRKDEKEKAQEYCISRNQKDKVKIVEGN